MPPPPPITANLLSLYGLQDLQKSVARTNAAGEKINRLRKSYEGHLKTLPLAGKNKAVKHDESKGMSLLDLTRWPEEEWYNQKVHGKDVHQGLPASIIAKLDKAMQMQPGLLPNNSELEDMLGHDKVKPAEPIAQIQKQGMNTTGRGSAHTNGIAANDEAIRPKRTGRKRRYDEHSFEGYGEGYVDDELDMGGYSSGDTQFSRRSAANKKRKKVRSRDPLSDEPYNPRSMF